MADTSDLGSDAEKRAGSSPVSGTLVCWCSSMVERRIVNPGRVGSTPATNAFDAGMAERSTQRSQKPSPVRACGFKSRFQYRVLSLHSPVVQWLGHGPLEPVIGVRLPAGEPGYLQRKGLK